jgi:hypothetical protein
MALGGIGNTYLFHNTGSLDKRHHGGRYGIARLLLQRVKMKEASTRFFLFEVALALYAISPFLDVVPPRTTFSEPPADVVFGMASLAEASAIFFALGAKVEWAFWRIGTSGVSGTMAGDDLAFKGTFGAATFFLLYKNVR